MSIYISDAPNKCDYVIKVRYENKLKWFDAYKDITDHDKLDKKNNIFDIFKFSSEVDIGLTYIDEDDDIIVLDDDNELYGVVINRRLNPLKTNVQLKSNASDASDF